MARLLPFAISSAFVLLSGCSSPAVAPPVESAPSPPEPAVAPASESPAAPEAASGSEGSCLMWYVCGCNVGCSKIATPRAELEAGLAVTVASGVEAGKPAFVHAHTDAKGAPVFSLAPDAPDAPVICARPDPRLFGYLCATDKSGDLDAHACDAQCAE